MTKTKELERKLNEMKKENKEKLTLLVQIAQAEFPANPEKSLKYAEQALLLADKLTINETKISMLNLLGKINFRKKDFRKAINNYQLAIKFADEVNLPEGKTTSLNLLANAYYQTGETQKALETFRELLKLYEKDDNKEGVALVLHNIGLIYKQIWKPEDALLLYFDALKIMEKLGKKGYIARILNNIGSVYELLEDFPQAKKYYEKSLKIAEESNDKNFISSPLNNLGNIYEEIGQYEKALEYMQKSLEIEEKNKNLRGMAISYNNIAYLYESIKNYVKALEFYKKSLEIKQKLHDEKKLTVAYNNIGAIYIKLKNLPEAENYLKKALQLAEKYQSKNELKLIYNSFYLLYAKKEDYQKALEFHLKFTKLKDELYNHETRAKIDELHKQYEIEKKEKENEILRKKNLELKDEIAKRKKTEAILKNLGDIFQHLSSDATQNIKYIVQETNKVLNGVCSLYNRLDDEEKSLYVFSSHNIPPDLDQRDKPTGHICYEATIKGRNKPVILQNLEGTEYEQTDPNVKKYHLKSYLGYPVSRAGKAIGSLCIVDVKPRVFSPTEVYVISVLAKAVSIEEERLLAEQRLSDEKRYYHSLVESLDDWVWEIDGNGIITYSNNAVEKILGYTAKEVVGQKMNRFWTPSQKKKSDNWFKNELLSGKGWKNYTTSFLHKTGKMVYLESTAIPFFDGKNCVGYRGINRDITERQLIQEKLKLSEQSYYELFNEAIDAIYIQDKNGKFIDVNKGAVKMYGYPREYFIGKTPEFVAAPGKNDLEKVKYYIAEAYKGHTQKFEFWGKRKNGEVFPKIVRLSAGNYFGKKVVIAFALDITEQKRAEEEIKKNVTYYRTLFESLPHGGEILDITGKILDCSVNTAKLLGYEKEEIIGHHITDFLRQEFKDVFKELFPSILKKGYGEAEVVFITKDGSEKIVRRIAQVIYGKNKKPEAILALNIDVTERRIAEYELRKSEEKYRNLVNSSPDGIFIADLEGNLLSVNRAVCMNLGYSEKELLKKKITDLIAPSYVKTFKSRLDELMKGERLKPFIYQISGKDGTSYYVETHSVPYYEKGKIVGFQGISRDMTDYVKLMEALQQNEKKYRELYGMIRLVSDTVPDMIWTKDLKGNFTFTNKAICEQLLNAKDTEEPIGKHVMYFVNRERAKHPDDKEWFTFGEACADSDAIVISSKKPGRFEEYGNVFGKFLILDVYKAPIFDETGKLVGTVGSARDITKEKEMEKEKEEFLHKIIQAKEEWEQTFDSISDLIMIIDENFKIIRVNKPFAQKFKKEPKEIIGKNSFDILNLKTGCLDHKIIYETQKDGKPRTAVLYDKNTKEYCLATVTPFKIANHGSKNGLIVVFRDITDIKKSEEELNIKQEHIKLINKILRHDISNNLAVIKSAINIYKSEKNEKLLEEASKRVFASVQLIRKMKDLEFSLLKKERLRPIKISDIIKKIKESYLAIKFKVEGDSYIIADEMFDSVIDNIVRNAVEHGRASEIQIIVKELKHEVELKIADNGVGIPNEIKKSIFEEGFKFGQRGHTGLGLFIVKNAIRSYGGTITVEDNIPSGAVFILRLQKAELLPQKQNR